MDVSLRVSTPSGDLELNAAPYELAGNTFETLAQSHRRIEVQNQYVEGTYVIHALRENVIEPVSFYVRGATHAEMVAALTPARDCWSQSTFQVRKEVEGVVEYWQCFASSFSVGTQREFLHATMARVDVQLEHAPGVPSWANQFSVLGTIV